jgi:hypothetical protein
MRKNIFSNYFSLKKALKVETLVLQGTEKESKGPD